MEFSFIITQTDDTEKLEALLSSIATQRFNGVECIIVDRSTEDHLSEVITPWRQSLSIQWIRTPGGVSEARNLGISRARGYIVAFPDEDYRLSSSLLSEVTRWFWKNPAYGMLAGRLNDHISEDDSNSFFMGGYPVRAHNASRIAPLTALFLRRDMAILSLFNEAQDSDPGGVGPFLRDASYILRLLAAGVRGFYDPDFQILHRVDQSVTRDFDAGMGWSYALGRTSHPLLSPALILLDLVSSLPLLVIGNWRAAVSKFRHAAGMGRGLIALASTLPGTAPAITSHAPGSSQADGRKLVAQ